MPADVEPERDSSQIETNASAIVSAKAVPAAPKTAAGPKRFVRQQIPDSILHDEQLLAATKALPGNYNFEIMKTVWRLRESKAKSVALQFPEGLLMYACVIADILEAHAHVEQAFIMGDVTYGACCIDDFSAAALGADFLVHYGHSCLVPVSQTKLPCLYVFVEIQVDTEHLVATVAHNLDPALRILLAGTIQFTAALQVAKRQLADKGFGNITIPQDRPLSAGETLGCTAPSVTANADVILFVADGRFHLEALMIANPTIPAYRYDPYGRKLLKEEYDQVGMRAARRAAIEAAQRCTRWGLVLGTLGRQGNPALLTKLKALLREKAKRVTLVLLSEVAPEKLAMMPGIEAWVQVACPRLSIDWGEGFQKPTLTPYEAMIALGAVQPWWADNTASSEQNTNIAISTDGTKAAANDNASIAHYPMDYYSKQGGEWSSSYHKAAAPRPRARARPQALASG